MAPLMLIFVRGKAVSAQSGKYNPATGQIEHPSTGSGQAIPAALVAITAVKYTGQEYDPETGFYYYNARYYDPQLGVFTTPDKKFDRGAGHFGFNRHMYVAGNPVMYNDPTGHFIWFVVAAAVIGGVMGGTGGDVKGWVNGSKQWDWGGALKGAAIGAAATTAAIGTGGLVTSGMTSMFGAGAAGTTSLGATVVGGAAGGFTGGFIGGSGMAWANGASFDQAMSAGLKAGLAGAVSGAVGGAFGHWARGIKADGFWSGAGKIGVESAGAFSRGFSGGFTYAKLNGMSDKDALSFGLRGGGISLGAYGLGKISPFRLTLRPNANRDSMCQTRACLFSDGDPSVGPRTNVPGTGDDHWFARTVARFFPGADSMSNMHDDMLDDLTEGTPLKGKLGTQMPDVLNYGTMVPALGFTAYDLALTMTENYGYMWR